MTMLTKLEELNLSNNKIQEIAEIKSLVNNKQLLRLIIIGNPITKKEAYLEMAE